MMFFIAGNSFEEIIAEAKHRLRIQVNAKEENLDESEGNTTQESNQESNVDFDCLTEESADTYDYDYDTLSPRLRDCRMPNTTKHDYNDYAFSHRHYNRTIIIVPTSSPTNATTNLEKQNLNPLLELIIPISVLGFMFLMGFTYWFYKRATRARKHVDREEGASLDVEAKSSLLERRRQSQRHWICA